MTRVKVELLRLILPATYEREAGAVRCAVRLPDGEWQGARLERLDAVVARYRPKHLEVCPHPADVSMIDAELPPLPPQRLRAGVRGAVELLALLPLDELAIGHGGREDNGKIPIAWMSSSALSQALQTLQRHGLRADVVLPLPAFLPAPGERDAATAIVIDGWVVMRIGANSGLLHPLSAQGGAEDQAEARMKSLFPEISRIQWLHKAQAADGASPTPWSGHGWGWTLPQGQRTSLATWPDWRRPALTWGAAALTVWLIGLNLYASRVESEGQNLKRQMTAQVKATFPELSIVLNPLQQARQLRDARTSGTTMAAAPDFTALLRASTALLARSAGQVQRLAYRDGQVEVQWREGAALKASEAEVLRAQAQERGISIESNASAIRLRANTEDQSPPATSALPEPAT